MKEKILKHLFIMIVSLILLLLCIIISLIENSLANPSEYTYISMNNEWGISKECNIDKKQITYCIIDNEITPVKQFYYIN